MTSQQRYLPFGGVREDAGSITQTDLGFTGQRNLDSEIGLMDYKARFYSNVLGRFIQPDSIISNAGNPQAFNRFAYVLNNPINFTDPSGHIYCGLGIQCGGGGTEGGSEATGVGGFSIDDQLSQLGIKTDDDMPNEYKKAIFKAALDTGASFSKSGEDAWGAYRAEYSSMTFVYDPNCFDCRNVAACKNQMSGTVMYDGEKVNCTPGGAITNGTDQITIASLSSSYPDARVTNIVHEYGHVYNNIYGGAPVAICLGSLLIIVR